MSLLQVLGTSKFGSNGQVVNNIHFVQQAFENIGIAGETGSGKTTLLKMIAGLIQADAGEIRLQNKQVPGPLDQLIPGHPQIAYLSQYFELRNNYWVYELLEMANKLPVENASLIYKVCQVEHLLNRRTDQLSGGEKQRIALARLLTASPLLLLLDEPFSNSDLLHKHLLKQVIHDIGEQLGISCILVSHDAVDLLSWAHTLLIMKDGEVIQKGSPAEVYFHPLNSYCAGILGAFNLIDGNSELITSIAADKYTGKSVMLRPEHLHVSRIPESPVEGLVIQYFFCGNFSMVDVRVGEDKLRIQTFDHTLRPGHKVYLTLSEKNIWVFPDAE